METRPKVRVISLRRVAPRLNPRKLFPPKGSLMELLTMEILDLIYRRFCSSDNRVHLFSLHSSQHFHQLELMRQLRPQHRKGVSTRVLQPSFGIALIQLMDICSNVICHHFLVSLNCYLSQHCGRPFPAYQVEIRNAPWDLSGG